MSAPVTPRTPLAFPTDTLLPPKAIGSNRNSIATSVSGDPSFKQGTPSYSNLPLDDDFSPNEKPKKGRSLVWVAFAVAGLAVIAVAVVVPVYFKVIKPNNNSSSAAVQQPSSGATKTTTGNVAQPTSTANPTNTVVTSGTDGSKVTKDDGSTFTYTNKFGGYWVWDPKNPYNNTARPQSWSPPLNEAWKYGVDQIRGVNLGGWLVLEPFIVPAMYEPYQPDTPGYTGVMAVDEYTLHQAIAADTKRGGLEKVMEEHYSTFITEEDFAMIAGAGMNWIRLPIPFWAVSKLADEPYLEGVAWKYFLKAIEWARKYGLRINLDLHTIPGSQNGFDHSGKLGTANWMHGVMGIANAQRSLNIIRSITEFISRDEIKDVVPMFGVLNEPPMATIGIEPITSYYLEMHDMMRAVTGAGKGPYISIHDGFDVSKLDGFLPGSDRIAIDQHLYLCFAQRLNDAPLAQQVNVPCTAWGAQFNRTLDTGVFITSGEWSLGFNDCAWYLNGASAGYRYDGTLPSYGGPRIGSCAEWLDSREWTAETKANLKQFALASMDAMQNYFFWTWRIGESSRTGQVNSPLWSYKLGLQNGWMPTDPREAAGTCANSNPRTATPNFTPATPPTISAATKAQFPFPPAALSDQANAAALPRYAQTGTPKVMQGSTYPSATVTVPSPTPNTNSWPGDYVPIEGCTYPDQWNAVGVAVPAQCAAA